MPQGTVGEFTRDAEWPVGENAREACARLTVLRKKGPDSFEPGPSVHPFYEITSTP
jgi:hypothetical protein